MAFLTKEQIVNLLKECENSTVPELATVVRSCLATGARWSEAESLTHTQVMPYKVTYTKTKGKRNRAFQLVKNYLTLYPKRPVVYSPHAMPPSALH